jgi:hypothetical protein
VLRRIQGVSGVFGMVAPCDKTCLLHPVVGTFHTGDTVRVVLPAEVIGKALWTLEDNNKSCGLKMTYDLPRGKSLETLTVRVCWCTTIFRDERDYIKTHFKYLCTCLVWSVDPYECVLLWLHLLHRVFFNAHSSTGSSSRCTPDLTDDVSFQSWVQDDPLPAYDDHVIDWLHAH